MENTIYMKLANIAGDVTEHNHKQWIKLSKIMFGASRKLKSEPGNISNRESTRPAMSQLTMTKPMDSASALLFGEACTGKSQPQITIDICKTGSSGLNTIATFTLENVVVSSYHLDTDSPFETITISFDKIEMKTIPYDAKGDQRTPISYSYDMKTATAA